MSKTVTYYFVFKQQRSITFLTVQSPSTLMSKFYTKLMEITEIYNIVEFY